MLVFGMSIATALFTDSQSRLYAWLFGQPERAYHLNEKKFQQYLTPVFQQGDVVIYQVP